MSTHHSSIKLGGSSYTPADDHDGVQTFEGQAFASLPATGVAGMVAYVTDSDTTTWGDTVAGGSTNKVLAWYNGTNWTVVGV